MGQAPGTPQPGGHVEPGWLAASWAGGPAGLDLRIDSGSLQTLRARVRDCAETSKLPADRVDDVVLALHELAANVIRHGGGTGRLRAWHLSGALRFQIDDGERPPMDVTAEAQGQAGTDVLPREAGHGLWVVERISDHMISRSGPGGTSVAVAFDLP